jgi:hypothetical protein
MGQELLDVGVGRHVCARNVGGGDGRDDVHVLVRERFERCGHEPTVVLELR